MSIRKDVYIYGTTSLYLSDTCRKKRRKHIKFVGVKIVQLLAQNHVGESSFCIGSRSTLSKGIMLQMISFDS
jgi:hypothetical protein